MAHKLFCEYSPTAYRISVLKCQMMRRIQDWCSRERFAAERSLRPLSVLLYGHNSLIRRRLGNVDMELQENKAVNLALAAPHINGLLIRPGETFSFWRLVGNPSAGRGYRAGLTIARGEPRPGIGGGMCQFTNLLHWMVLHTPLEIVEHHHHDGYDLFPDFHRQVPFGTGTSIQYNYLDYRFRNPTDAVFQLLVTVSGDYLKGELRSDKAMDRRYHIRTKNEGFCHEGDSVYRVGEVWRVCVDVRTGSEIANERLNVNHAKVMYDTAILPESGRSMPAP